MHTYTYTFFSFILTTIGQRQTKVSKKPLQQSWQSNGGQSATDIGGRIIDRRKQEDSRSVWVKMLTGVDYRSVRKEWNRHGPPGFEPKLLGRWCYCSVGEKKTREEQVVRGMGG